MSLFTAAPTPSGRRRAVPRPAAVPDPEPHATVSADGGHVLFAVGATTFAVSVGDVHEITRAPRLDLLPDAGRSGYGLAVALVDVRGRSVPVVDLRTDRSRAGDVLLPVYRHHAGLVVDRVVRVTAAGELVPEAGDVAETLPSWTRGVVRPAAGGDPVVVVALPDAAAIEAGAARGGEPPLGAPVLSAEG